MRTSNTTTPDRVMIPLNLPPRELHPNERVHHMKEARLKNAYRMSAWAIAKSALSGAGISSSWRRVTVTYHFFFPVRRNRDGDNLIAWMIQGLNGIKDAGLVPDDSTQHVDMQTPTVEIDRDHPRVDVECERVET